MIAMLFYVRRVPFEECYKRKTLCGKLVGKDNGNEYDYGFRVYSSRLGRFLSVDPLQGDYPELTPYQFASNNPIEGIDLDGLEFTVGQLKMIKEQAQTFLKKMASSEAGISARGFSNAFANANSFGISDNLPSWTGLNTDNLDDYDNKFDKQTYLTGRVLGDIAALIQSASEVDGGLTTAAAGSETVVVGLTGLGVAADGAGVGAAGTYDLNWALGKLIQLGVTFSATKDESNTTNQSANDQNNASHGNQNASESNTSNDKLKKEAAEAKAKEEQAKNRLAKRQAASKAGKNKIGNSNKEVRGDHNNLQGGGGKAKQNRHENANARRAKEQAAADAKKKKKN